MSCCIKIVIYIIHSTLLPPLLFHLHSNHFFTPFTVMIFSCLPFNFYFRPALKTSSWIVFYNFIYPFVQFFGSNKIFFIHKAPLFLLTELTRLKLSYHHISRAIGRLAVSRQSLVLSCQTLKKQSITFAIFAGQVCFTDCFEALPSTQPTTVYVSCRRWAVLLQ